MVAIRGALHTLFGQHIVAPQTDIQSFTALGLSHIELQDVVTCLLLSEVVYKAAEGLPAAAVQALGELRAHFPRGLAPLTAVQFCRHSAEQRYMLGRSREALYVCFMGTKHARDFLTDANVLARLLWEAEAVAATEEAAGSGSAAAAAAAGLSAAQGPAVHRGFLGRAEAVPVESLYAHAQRQGLRLVLCGHSLGGAVAQLATLRLLHLLRHTTPPAGTSLGCVAFGSPALGNAALELHVRQQGWQQHFISIALPEDPVPRLLLPLPAWRQQAQQASVADPTQALSGRQAEEALEAALGSPPDQQPVQQQAPAEAGLQPALQDNSAAGAAGAADVSTSSVATSGSQQLAETASASSMPSLVNSDSSSSSGWRASVAGWRVAGAARAAAAAAMLAQRPLAAAAGAASTAARSARAGAAMLMPPLLLPAFVHFGQQYHLWHHGLLPATGAVPTAAGLAAAMVAPAAPGGGLNNTQQPLPPSQRQQQQQQQQQQQLQLQEQLLGLHSMRHYRSRAAALCWQAFERQHKGDSPGHAVAAAASLSASALAAAAAAAEAGAAAADGGVDQVYPPVELSSSLAPAVALRQATARLPLLPLLQRQGQQGLEQPALLTVLVNGSGLEGCSGALLRLPGSRVAVRAAAVTNLARQRLVEELQSSASGRSSPHTSSAAVGTGGWLQAAGSRLRRLAPALPAFVGSSSWAHQQEQHGHRHGHGHGHGHGGQHNQQQQEEQAGLVLQFAVPPAAIRQLQLQPGGQVAEAGLVLLTDFTKHPCPVGLHPMAVWVLSLDDGLSAAVMSGLQAGAQAPAEQQQRGQQGQGQRWRQLAGLPTRRWLPGVPSLPLSDPAAATGAALRAAWLGSRREAGTSSSVAGGDRGALVGEHAQQQQPATPLHYRQQQQQQQQQATPQQATAAQQQAGSEAQPPSSWRQQVGARVRELAASVRHYHQHQQEQQPDLGVPALLLHGGLLVLDVAPALAGSGGGSGASSSGHGGSGGSSSLASPASSPAPSAASSAASVVQQLELAAEAVRWRGGQHRGATSAAEGSLRAKPRSAAGDATSAEDADAELEVDAAELEAGDESWAELGRLGLAARLRRQLAQAGATARRRTLLLRRRRRATLRRLPAPDILVLVVHHRQLLSSAYGEGLDAAVLAAVARLAAACRASGGVKLLLAVASPRQLSAPYRQQLAYSSSLWGGSMNGIGGSSSSGSGGIGGTSQLGGVVPMLLTAAAEGSTSSSSTGVGSQRGVLPTVQQPRTAQAGLESSGLQVGLLQAALHSFAAARRQEQSRAGEASLPGAARSRL